LVYNNSGDGIYIPTSPLTKIYNNTVYLNGGYGIYLLNTAINCEVKNNIVLNYSSTCIRIDASSQPGVVCNYNDFYCENAAASVGNWGATGYKTLALWQAASGQDANSISLRAIFVSVNGASVINAAITDYSPCVGIGTNLSAIFTNDFNGAIRTDPWDMGAYIKSAVYIPIIQNQILSNYAPTQDQNITAQCNVLGTPDHVIVKINGKPFKLFLSSGNLYTASIKAYLIGECIAQTAYFMATNLWGGSDEIAPATITIPAMTSYNINLIELAIINCLNTITDFKSVLQNEPKQIPALPAATLYYDGFTQSQTEAVSFTITHKWILRIYVKLHDAEDAQIQIKDLIGKVLAVLKQNLDFNQTVLFGFSDSGSVVVLMDRDAPVMIAELNLTGLLEVD